MLKCQVIVLGSRLVSRDPHHWVGTFPTRFGSFFTSHARFSLLPVFFLGDNNSTYRCFHASLLILLLHCLEDWGRRKLQFSVVLVWISCQSITVPFVWIRGCTIAIDSWNSSFNSSVRAFYDHAIAEYIENSESLHRWRKRMHVLEQSTM